MIMMLVLERQFQKNGVASLVDLIICAGERASEREGGTWSRQRLGEDLRELMRHHDRPVHDSIGSFPLLGVREVQVFKIAVVEE